MSSISVLISIYKKDNPNFLNDALNSIWDLQTFKPKEIVLIIDGKLNIELEFVIRDWQEKLKEKLIIISGKPGTGKTIKLIRIGFDLVNNRGAKCLLLTYNKALVSDIKRTIHFATFNESVRDKQFNIQTSHKFFYHLGKVVSI